MKWTVWDVMRLLLVVAASRAGGMGLIWGFGWLVLWFDKVVNSWHSNIVWELFSAAVGVVLLVFVVRGQLAKLITTIKGYSAKQMFFGDDPHRLLRVEEK